MTDTRTSPPFGSDAVLGLLRAAPAARDRRHRRHLILPVITLVVVSIAGDSRFVRASMLESLSQDYVRTAKAKGLPARTVTFKHALRNALLPVVTNIGLEIPFLFTGRDRHRDDLLVARHRQADHRRDPRASTTRS